MSHVWMSHVVLHACVYIHIRVCACVSVRACLYVCEVMSHVACVDESCLTSCMRMHQPLAGHDVRS